MLTPSGVTRFSLSLSISLSPVCPCHCAGWVHYSHSEFYCCCHRFHANWCELPSFLGQSESSSGSRNRNRHRYWTCVCVSEFGFGLSIAPDANPLWFYEPQLHKTFPTSQRKSKQGGWYGYGYGCGYGRGYGNGYRWMELEWRFGISNPPAVLTLPDWLMITVIMPPKCVRSSGRTDGQADRWMDCGGIVYA